MTKKNKVIPFLGISILLVLSILSSTADVFAQYSHGTAGKFEPTKENPTEYGVIIPDPNIYATASIYGSNQGEFHIMNWDNSLSSDEKVNVTGNDISLAYPWYFENYILDSTTNNGYIDPFNDINWANVSALGVENETVSAYFVNTVWNSYSMSGSGSLDISLNSSIPIEVNINIASSGPKMLKFNWNLDDPTVFPITATRLISPNNKTVARKYEQAYYSSVNPSNRIFSYMLFIADRPGTYRLLVNSQYGQEFAELNLEFMNFDITNIPKDGVVNGGDGADFPNVIEIWEDKWDMEWFKIDGKQGEHFVLDYGLIYGNEGSYSVYFWTPTEDGYAVSTDKLTGSYDLYFPTDETFFISLKDDVSMSPEKVSFSLKEVPLVQHEIGGNTTITKVSRNQRKAINFSVPEDSFVVLNYTSWGKGNPKIVFDGTANDLIYRDSASMKGYGIIPPLREVVVDEKTYYYYYLPAGEYRALVKNVDITNDGVLQLSSRVIEYLNGTIPINSLSYPNKYASSFTQVTFNSTEKHDSLKGAQWLTLNITETGQYRLNTTIKAAQNPGCASTRSPQHLYVYNATNDTYYRFNYPNLTYFLDVDDYIYIGMDCKYTGLLVNLSNTGAGQFSVQMWAEDNGGWQNLPNTDGTNDLSKNGTIEFDVGDQRFTDWWQRGRDISSDIEQIDNETESDLYWLRLNCNNDYDAFPNITKITILNTTISGNLNITILKQSGYVYGDYWEIDESNSRLLDFADIQTARDESPLYQRYTKYDSQGRFIITDDHSEPYIIGFEEGIYKVLIIPTDWCYSGQIVANFGVENYWPYKEYHYYNISQISPEPSFYAYEIDTFTNVSYGNSGSLTGYPWSKSFNYTENMMPVSSISKDGYMLLRCFGEAYKWTQLVTYTENVSNYNIYLIQDLPWQSNQPDSEVAQLVLNEDNSSLYEFGVFKDEFYLLFEYNNLMANETITFKLSLSQYNTTKIFSTSYATSAGIEGSNILFTGLIIGGIAAVVIGVVVVIIKKRGGRVFSKTPG